MLEIFIYNGLLLDKEKYTRPWFAWANGLFGQAILKIAKERPYLIFKE